METSPVWFITGCSTGFGRELAKLALHRRCRVVVTARNPQTIQNFAAEYPSRCLALALDVTDREQMAAAVAAAEDRFGRVDVLVNNAGYGYLAAVEEGEEDEVRRMFETNFYGLVALTKRVLPGMRERRRGHIVNFSSILGLTGLFAGCGYYAATKFAVEGFSEALFKEVEPLGLHVTLVEPGPFRTDWAGRSLRQTRRRISEYDETAGRRRAEIAANKNRPGDPEMAAEAIFTAVESERPPLHLILGRSALGNARIKFALLRDLADEWESVGLSADAPEIEVPA